MAVQDTLKEYMDYATFHGIGRAKNTPYLFLKIFWVFALFGSLGMIIWQVSDLYGKYKSYPISTSVEVKVATELEFPRIVICNMNLAKYENIPNDSDLEKIIESASNEYSVDLSIFNASDIYEYNYTAYDESSKDKTISHDILFKTAEKFRMTLSVLDDETLMNMSQPQHEFILLCNFAGEKCSEKALDTVRTYQYGMCYSFDPMLQKSTEPHGMVSAVGPRYSLEVLLNVEQGASVPFVTSSSGVAIGIQLEDRYFHPQQSVFVPTGFETNIALSQVRKQSVPGKKEPKRCIDADRYGSESPLDCERSCRQDDIRLTCDCYQYFFDIGVINITVPLNRTVDPDTGFSPCFTEAHYTCIQKRMAEYITQPPSTCSNCLSRCKEVVYEREISMVSWPDENYIPLLRRIMQKKLKESHLSELDRDFVRGNLALVRIYLSSLSYQYIKEEYTYSKFVEEYEQSGTKTMISLAKYIVTKTEVDFISDIGGQLGLWVGCSVLSVFEVAELVVLLIASCRGKKTCPREQELPGKKEDGT